MVAILVALLLQSAYPTPPPHLNLFAALFSPMPQEPRVLPSHTHGPHANEPGAKCSRSETEMRGDITFYKCACPLICEGQDQREADDCVTSCGTKQCLCHEQAPCPPDVQPAPKK